MRGIFRIAMMTGMVASMYTGYRAVSRRKGQNPAGLGDANLGSTERRRAAALFRWPGRQRNDHDTEGVEATEASDAIDRITE